MNGRVDVDNVVVLVIDALRADRVGAYGSHRELTPTIDHLAEQGTVFDRAFSCINTTDPSLTSIHTGRQPRSTVIHHGGLVTDEEKQRIESVEYVPEALSQADIRTIATGRVIGRWHHRGFTDYSWSNVGATEVKLSETLQNIHPLLHRVLAGLYNRFADPLKQASDGESNAVEDFLEKAEREPFYGFVHLMDTHAWYEADEDLINRLLETYEYPDGDLQEFFDENEESPVVSKLLEPNATDADFEVGMARMFARYDATVREADQKLKRLIEGLRERNQWDNTALFVLSDHGESLHEHGIYFDHHGLYEQTVHVPLIAHVPGTTSNMVEDLVQLHDLGPTILDLFDLDGLSEADGRSLVGYIADHIEPPEPRQSVLLEEAHAQRRRGLRTDQYKYIEHLHDKVLADFWDTDSFECGYCRCSHGEKVELYDLKEDPGETRNIASDREATVNDLREELEKQLARVSTIETIDREVTYEDEEEVMDRLEDLGYR